jgi:hypothetical protein
MIGCSKSNAMLIMNYSEMIEILENDTQEIKLILIYDLFLN